MIKSDLIFVYCWSLYWGQELWLDCTIYELLFFASEVIWNAAAKSSSIQFIRSVVSDSLQPHKSQNTRTPCSSRTPRVHSNSCPSSQWCHPAISSSVGPFFSIRVFCNESTLRTRWPKYWSFSFNISPSNEHPGLISFRISFRMDLLAVQGTLKSLLQHHSANHQFFGAQLSS